MISEIHAVIKDVFARRSLDARTCYVDVYAQAPGGRVIVVECSDPGVADEVLERLAARVGTGSVRIVLLPAVAETMPELLVVSTSVADVRRLPEHGAELVTQAIAGEPLVPLKETGDWYLTRLEDGYIGWIRSWHVSPTRRSALDRFLSTARYRVKNNIVQIFESPDEASLPVADAVVGTTLAASPCGRRGWRKVELADGRSGFTRARGVERIPRRRRPSRDKLAATGLRFLGIPYLWGGTTPKGFDCSGLIQRVFMLQGIRLPRDSDQQSKAGRPKLASTPDDLDTGDLLFFGKREGSITHVAMYLSDGLFLHAYGHVRVGALDPVHPLHDARLARDWRLTRDVLA